MKNFRALGVAIAFVASATSFGSVHWYYSETDLAVNVGPAADFSNSNGKFSAYQQLYADHAGDSLNWGWGTYYNTDTTVDHSPSVTLSGLSISTNSIYYTTTFNDPSNLSGSVDHHYTLYGQSSAGTPLYYHVVGGQDVLDIIPSYYYVGQDAGTVSAVGVTIAGNWSTLGTSSGDHQLLGLDPNFHIIKNFVYDSQTNVTTFSALDFSFPGYGSNSASIRLYGPTAAPEPASIAALAVGLASLLRRRRK